MSLKEFFESDDLRNRFETAGYSSLKELQNKGILQLAQEVELTEEEVALVGSILHEGSNTLRQGISAATLVKEQYHGITTSCTRIDQLFAPVHGIPKRSITEISGAPGSGKTQFCIQLSLNVQQSMEQGGLGGGCIYIDTEGGLMEDRFLQMAQTSKDPEVARLNLQNIRIFRVLDHLEMIALVHQLPDIFNAHPNAKLLIIDSISYHLRLNIKDHRTRIAIMNLIGQSLVRIADQFNVSIVVTNQASPDLNFGTWRPTLGASWSQWCGNRLFLTRKRHQRHATMYSAPQQSSNSMAPFLITQNGIEDVDEETLARVKEWQESESSLVEKTLKNWQRSDLDSEHYNLEEEKDLSPWPTTTRDNENESRQHRNELAGIHTTDTSPQASPLHASPQDDEQDDVYILAPDSQPEHSYVDGSIYYAPDTSTDSTPRRRLSSSTQDSSTKRQRPLDDSGKGWVNNSFEILCDSQGDNNWLYDYDESPTPMTMLSPLSP